MAMVDTELDLAENQNIRVGTETLRSAAESW